MEKNKAVGALEKTPGSNSVLTINAESLNTASTLKLTENEVRGSRMTGIAISEKEPYNPVDYRDFTNATTDKGALIHLIKSSLGSGILAMPGAFKYGGSVFSLIGTVVIGILCTHCVHILVHCAQLLCIRTKRPSLGFAETAEVACKTGPPSLKKFSSVAREFVNAALFATYYFGNTVYVVFIADSLQQVVNEQTGFNMDIRFYILLVAIPLLPLGLIRHLKYLVPFSFVATVFILFGLVMTVYFILIDLPPISSTHYIGNLTSVPIFFSTVLFAMEGIGTVLPIENSMKTPYHFLGCPGVLNIAMTLVVLLYSSVGFFGYVKFGEGTRPSVTLNLGKTWLAEVVKILVALSILFTYGLQFTVPSEIMWKKISHKFSEARQDISYYVMRALMICGTVLVAIAVPQLGPIIGLVGSVCFSILGLLCPAMIEAVTYYGEGYGFLRWRLVKDIIIGIIAIFALVVGTYASLEDAIKAYSHSQ